ncbi:shares a domain with a conserved HREF motif with the CWF15 that is involved in mRNA splicing [Cryptosporidium sp. chipmunk genotype I]|uniref:shares a domain with a conserved HREF motif with the CWF15 that is involved in mRNA splicing n=1 Tax=Cryptosporidium sp. chipmunk genotype I TaxID=1280935 RepID=UPI003519FA37|nr:shares a domain with a conserved HREF motif with the CWF15 that is involved in mRNA splicing [Cryptosporidium sp. chipmunk genotype I]
MSGHFVNRYTIESGKLHKSDQRGHLTLKYRRNATETGKVESVIRVERDVKQSSPSDSVTEARTESSAFEVNDGNQIIKAAHISPKEDLESEGESELEIGSEIEEEELNDDEELLRELDKIKKERAEREKEKKNNDIKLMMQSNPLLEEYHENDVGRDKEDRDESEREEYVLKKRWTEDTVFRNQNRVSQPKKRFINDILHSDQHREFMRKYIL